MTSTEVLSMYENIAGLTGKMAVAAQIGDFDALDRLENQCAAAAVPAIGGVTKLEGAARQRKIDLLKQILANDRAVRDVTEPWLGRFNGCFTCLIQKSARRALFYYLFGITRLLPQLPHPPAPSPPPRRSPLRRSPTCASSATP
jgi:flagellar protein FliT